MSLRKLFFFRNGTVTCTNTHFTLTYTHNHTNSMHFQRGVKPPCWGVSSANATRGSGVGATTRYVPTYPGYTQNTFLSFYPKVRYRRSPIEEIFLTFRIRFRFANAAVKTTTRRWGPSIFTILHTRGFGCATLDTGSLFALIAPRRSPLVRLSIGIQKQWPRSHGLVHQIHRP